MSAISNVGEIPTNPHIAVICSKIIHHEGDSRDPGWNETVFDYIPFKDKDEFDLWYKTNINLQKEFRVLQVSSVKVSIKVETSFG